MVGDSTFKEGEGFKGIVKELTFEEGIAEGEGFEEGVVVGIVRGSDSVGNTNISILQASVYPHTCIGGIIGSGTSGKETRKRHHRRVDRFS